MKSFRHLFFAVVLCASIMATSGCALLIGAAAGVGGYAWIKGALEKNLDYSVSQVHTASLRALKSLKIFVSDDDIQQHEAKINFEYEDGAKGEIKIEALTEKASRICIRIGIMGDKDKSQVIFNAIKKNL